jgi:hypothetical protein
MDGVTPVVLSRGTPRLATLNSTQGWASFPATFRARSKPLATGLVLWSFGLLVARACGLSAVAGI